MKSKTQTGKPAMSKRTKTVLVVVIILGLGYFLSGFGGGTFPDCPPGRNGQGVAACNKAEEGQRCQARNPDMVLTCHECMRMDQASVDLMRSEGTTNPKCK